MIEMRVTERRRERAVEARRLLDLAAKGRATPDELRQVEWNLGHRLPKVP
jgi:hypothetical protein